MSYVTTTRRADETGRSRGRGPVDAWLRRQLKARFDGALGEKLPAEWLELAGNPPDGPDQNKP